MQARIEAELTLIRQWFPDVEYRLEGCWVCVPSYPLPEGWNRERTDVAFQISQGHPVQPPYGFCVPAGIQFRGNTPNNYTEPIANQPPFEGTWGLFSWTPAAKSWKPTADVQEGANLLDWVKGFKDRFNDGQ